jgi:hypothetical protein
MKIVSGRLYNYKGATVRALKRDEKAGVRLVSFHEALFGFVQDSELQKIDTRKVNDYLVEANKGHTKVVCPYCKDVIYERDDGPLQELSCGIAYGRHEPNCKKRPNYIESDIDKLRKQILEGLI